MLIISRPSLEYIYFNTKKVKIIIFMPDLATISEKRRKSRESTGAIVKAASLICCLPRQIFHGSHYVPMEWDISVPLLLYILYLLYPKKKSATTPGPVWAPITGPT